MGWFMDPAPDGETVRQVSTALRGARSPYSTQIQLVQNTHDQTLVLWQGADSDAHTQATIATQELAQQQAGWMTTLSDVLDVLGTILQVIFYLQMAWMAIQLATAAWALFTAGLDALVTEGPAAALAVTIQGLKDLIVTVLQGFVKALLSPATRAGAIIGGLVGVGVGVNTVEQQHLSGWNAFLTILGDTGQGAYVGGSIGMMFTGFGDSAPSVTNDDPALLNSDQPFGGRGPTFDDSPTGARGPYSGRPFDPDAAGGPIADPPLTTDGVTITTDGVQQVEAHLSRFPDPGQGLGEPEQVMLNRLQQIAAGKLEPTQYDLNFYTHELDEFARYKALGWETGVPSDPNAAGDLWNNTHTAALEDYGLKEFVKNELGLREWQLYDPSLWDILGR